MQLIDYLDRGWALDPAAPCFTMAGRRWSYGEVVERSHRFAAAAHRDGFVAGDRMAVLSPNDPEAFVAVLGGLRAQLAWIPVNPRYAIADIGDLLHRFGCALLVVHPAFVPSLTAIRAVAPGIRAVITLDDALDEWLAAPGVRHDPLPAAPDDVAVIMATGGTTGRPRGVLQTHRGFETAVANQMIAMWHGARPSYLVAAPMTHAAGFICFAMLARGAVIHVLDGAHPADVAAAMVEHRITDLFLPPTVIYAMLADPAIRALRFPALRYLLYGAAPTSVAKLREALEWLGPVLVEGYGQVEALMFCTILRAEDHFRDGAIAEDARLSSCGRPAALSSLAIMDEHGALLGTGEVGEVVVRAGLVMKGYLDDAAATAAASRFGWHHTGDVGYRDAEGFYHLVDRTRDVIISGGYNIYPSEIEQVLWTHPAVQDCAVVGAPDERWGEAVTAVVELKRDARVDAAALIALCRERLGPIKAPKSVVFRDELPRSPVGKVLKRDIRETFWAAAGRRI